MLHSKQKTYFKYPKEAERSLRLALFLFPVWGLTWLAFWFVFKRFHLNGPTIPLLLGRNVFCFVLAALPVLSGWQALKELHRHSGYSVGYLRAIIGIALGASFLIVETITLALIVSFVLQRNMLT